MVETKIPKDIRVYKTKILGPLTFRQMICFGIALGIDFFLYQSILSGLKLPMESNFYIITAIDVCILAFGYLEPMGLPLEKYVKKMFISFFFVPQKRYPKCVIYKKKYKKLDEKTHNKKQQAIMKKDPELKLYN